MKFTKFLNILQVEHKLKNNLVQNRQHRKVEKLENNNVIRANTMKQFKNYIWTGKMGQWLKVIANFLQDTSLVNIFHVTPALEH